MNSSRIMWIVVLLAVLVVINLPLPASLRLKFGARDGFAPYQNIMAALLDKGHEAFRFVVSAHAATRERDALATAVVELKQELRHMEAAARENEELRAMLGYKQSARHKLLLCGVVSRGDVSGWWQTVRLNRGSLDGIQPDMAVVTDKGLAGKTVEVSQRTADVILLTDPACKVACKFTRTGALGVMRGGGVKTVGDTFLEVLCAPRPFRVDYVAKDQDIQNGDEVVTSGLGGIFPREIHIGTVERIGQHSSGLYQCADVVPSADLHALRYVFVVLSSETATGDHGRK